MIFPFGFSGGCQVTSRTNWDDPVISRFRGGLEPENYIFFFLTIQFIKDSYGLLKFKAILTFLTSVPNVDSLIPSTVSGWMIWTFRSAVTGMTESTILTIAETIVATHHSSVPVGSKTQY